MVLMGGSARGDETPSRGTVRVHTMCGMAVPEDAWEFLRRRAELEPSLPLNGVAGRGY